MNANAAGWVFTEDHDVWSTLCRHAERCLDAVDEYPDDDTVTAYEDVRRFCDAIVCIKDGSLDPLAALTRISVTVDNQPVVLYYLEEGNWRCYYQLDVNRQTGHAAFIKYRNPDTEDWEGDDPEE